MGSSGPQKLYSSSPDLTIQFHSDPAGLIFGKGQGFIMNYIGTGSRVCDTQPAQTVQLQGLEQGESLRHQHCLHITKAPAEPPAQLQVSGSVTSGVSLYVSSPSG